MKTSLLFFLLLVCLCGCTGIARWYTKNVAHTSSMMEGPGPAPDPSLFGPLPEPTTNVPPWLFTNVDAVATTQYVAFTYPDNYGWVTRWGIEGTTDLVHWVTVITNASGAPLVHATKPFMAFRVRGVP